MMATRNGLKPSKSPEQIFADHVLDVQVINDRFGDPVQVKVYVDQAEKGVPAQIRELLLAEGRADMTIDGNILIFTDVHGPKHFKFLADSARICYQTLIFGRQRELQIEEKYAADLFNNIEGFEDLKDVFRRSLRAEKPVSMLIHGPPSTAKTLFLLEIARLPRSLYILGSTTSKAGVTAHMLARPDTRLLLIDEIDKMAHTEYAALLSLMETGIVAELKYNRTQRVKAKTWIFAAANSLDLLPAELKSRFLRFKIPEYDRDTFIKVAVATLTTREGKDQETAKTIATLVAGGQRDVRDCIKIARLAHTPEDARRIHQTILNYKEPTLWAGLRGSQHVSQNSQVK